MRSVLSVLALSLSLFFFTSTPAYADCGSCGSDGAEDHSHEKHCQKKCKDSKDKTACEKKCKDEHNKPKPKSS